MNITCRFTHHDQNARRHTFGIAATLGYGVCHEKIGYGMMENSGLNLLSLIRYARCTDPSSVAVFLLLSCLPPFQVQPSSVTNSDLAKLQRSALQ